MNYLQSWKLTPAIHVANLPPEKPICHLLKRWVAERCYLGQFYTVKGIINALDQKEFYLVLYLVMGGNWAVTGPSIIATR